MNELRQAINDMRDWVNRYQSEEHDVNTYGDNPHGVEDWSRGYQAAVDDFLEALEEMEEGM